MYVTSAEPREAVGQILLHNVPDAAGRKLLAKGHRVVAGDVVRLQALGLRSVDVAVLEAGDVHEDEAARRVAAAVAGAQLMPTRAAASRVNLLAGVDGVVDVKLDVLLAVNELDGVTVASVRTHTRVRPKQRVATVKVIPFALPAGVVQEAERIAGQQGAAIEVRALTLRTVGVVVVGSVPTHARLQAGFVPSLLARIAAAGSQALAPVLVAPEEGTIAAALEQLRQAGAQVVLIAGATSIMDRQDVIPRAILRAGGTIEQFGAPVEPGNLLLLAYLRDHADRPLPVIGAPGCVRSRSTNVVDLVLPRLLTGEYLTKRDIVLLGHGGLLS